MTEYIIPIDDDALDWDEMFVAVIRKQEELIRCKDCKYSRDVYGDGDCYCDNKREMLRYIGDWNYYCGWAKKRS